MGRRLLTGSPRQRQNCIVRHIIVGVFPIEIHVGIVPRRNALPHKYICAATLHVSTGWSGTRGDPARSVPKSRFPIERRFFAPTCHSVRRRRTSGRNDSWNASRPRSDRCARYAFSRHRVCTGESRTAGT